MLIWKLCGKLFLKQPFKLEEAACIIDYKNKNCPLNTALFPKKYTAILQ